MKGRIRALLVAAALLGAAPTAGDLASAAAGPSATAAKACSSSYVHGVIGGSHKCLRRGQYCARRHDRQYHRFGFHCHKRDRNGDYHLT